MFLSLQSPKAGLLQWTALVVPLLIFVFLVAAACTSRIDMTPLAWKLEGMSVPKDFKTYTFFVTTSPEYVGNNWNEVMQALRRNFQVFGDSIGDRNLAVWVNDPGSDLLSVSRGRYFAERYASAIGTTIDYNGGPYVLVTNVHPDELPEATKYANEEEPAVIMIGFNNISPNRVIEVLNALDKHLRYDDKLVAGPIRMEVLWVKIKSWWDDPDNRSLVKDIVIILFPVVFRKADFPGATHEAIEVLN